MAPSILIPASTSRCCVVHALLSLGLLRTAAFSTTSRASAHSLKSSSILKSTQARLPSARACFSKSYRTHPTTRWSGNDKPWATSTLSTASCCFALGRVAACRKLHTGSSGHWREVEPVGGNLYGETVAHHVHASKEGEGEKAPRPELPGLRRTVWEQQDRQVEYPKLTRDVSADVVVVGAGIAGLSTAYHLAKAGKSVIVLEAHCRGAGMTGRTTAHIMPWYDDYYQNVEKDFGLAKAKIVGESYRSAIDWVERIVIDEHIDCDFTRLNGYLFPHEDTKQAHDLLQQEYEASRRVGFDVRMVDLGKDPVSGHIGTAIEFPRAADFHPLKYLDGLARALTRRGGKLYEMTRVVKTQGNQVTTEDDITVTAGAVVLATCSPINHNIAIHARQVPKRTYVVGLRIPRGSVKRAQYWDTAQPYHYVRLEPKGDYDILVVGGEDTSIGIKPTDYHDPYKNLELWAKKRWTLAEDVEYSWTGEWFDPADYLHLIGPDPLEFGAHDQYIATGDSGQGMTGGTIAGVLLSDLILGRENPWAEVYSPRRALPLSKDTVKSVGEEVMHTIQGYKDRVLPITGADSVDIEDLLPSSGAVIQKGFHKIAVYKDENGQVHKYSAVCPHMKCSVKWNPVDGSFDCPCHGSVFDCYGRVVSAPAKQDLSPIVS